MNPIQRDRRLLFLQGTPGNLDTPLGCLPGPVKPRKCEPARFIVGKRFDGLLDLG